LGSLRPSWSHLGPSRTLQWVAPPHLPGPGEGVGGGVNPSPKQGKERFWQREENNSLHHLAQRAGGISRHLGNTWGPPAKKRGRRLHFRIGALLGPPGEPSGPRLDGTRKAGRDGPRRVRGVEFEQVLVGERERLSKAYCDVAEERLTAEECFVL